MALVPVASVGGGVVVLYADVNDSGACVGARLENGAGRDVTVALYQGVNDMATGTYAPGTHTKNLPKPKQFDWATSDVRAELTVRWP